MQVARREEYLRGIEQGLTWCTSRQGEDGSYRSGDDDLMTYYKSPYGLTLTGQYEAAYRAVNWIGRRYLKADGDLGGGKAKTVVEEIPRHLYCYPNAWVAAGAQVCGRFDVAEKALAFILSRQDASRGGFYCVEGEPPGKEARQDVGSTSACGFAALFCGRVDAARRAGDFLLRMLEVQPEPNRFFLSYRESTGPVSDVGASPAILMVIDSKATRQAYWYLGFAIGFLCKLYLATGEERYLEGARRYFRFSTRCASDVHQTYASGKLGWGAACLYRLTQDEAYRSAAQNVLAYLRGSQLPDGSWYYAEDYPSPEAQPTHVTFDLTIELVLWYAEILRELEC